MYYEASTTGRPGPKKAVGSLHQVIDIQSGPQPISHWLEQLIVKNGWEKNPIVVHEKAEKWAARMPGAFLGRFHLAICYAQLGRYSEAFEAAAEVRRLVPRFSSRRLLDCLHMPIMLKARYLNGVSKSGLPD